MVDAFPDRLELIILLTARFVTLIFTAAVTRLFVCLIVLQILDPRTVMTFLDHSPRTKAAHLSSVKTSAAIS